MSYHNFPSYSESLNRMTTKPICWGGAPLSGYHLWSIAVDLAGFNKQGCVLVVPLTPGSAATTSPLRSTVILTTTTPC